MTGPAGGGLPSPSPPPAPLVLTAVLPGPLQARADALRRAHFPPERNHLAAHVTLFHALPPSAEGEVRVLLGRLAREPAPVARLTGLMNLGGGTALAIESTAMMALREEIAERLHGLLTAQDRGRPRLHATIQNKVEHAAARALQAALGPAFEPEDFRFAGLALHRYLGGPWEPLGLWKFRG